MSSIFQRANPAIEKTFAAAGSPRKVMCIPIDYAKRQHTALVCNGEGRPLRGAFNVHNNPAGVEFLEEVIGGLCRKHSIRKAQVFFGGCIQEVDKDIARRLAPTPGAMLTTVPGIGVTLGAALYAEIGDPTRDRCLKRLAG